MGRLLNGACNLSVLTLEHGERWKWAFLKHYQYNTNMTPNRTQIQSLTQKTDESLKEYARRWRELAARVQPPLLERELVDMFMSTLQGPYLDRMVGSASSSF